MRLNSEGVAEGVYCLNNFSDGSFQGFVKDQIPALNKVRQSLGSDAPMGLGFRFGASELAALNAPEVRQEFLEHLAVHNFYGVTFNAFPFGTFHKERVKENVYAPDWRCAERLAYTLAAARLLVDTLPEGGEGSVSTLPGSYGAWIKTREDVASIRRNLLHAVVGLRDLEEETGRLVHLGLEPEPDGFLESTPQCVSFWNDELLKEGVDELAVMSGASTSQCEGWIRRYLGICFDACHLALQFETLADSVATLHAEGIRISKAHISAALDLAPSGEALQRVEEFKEPVYLHQVRGQTREQSVVGWSDLPRALPELANAQLDRVRVHFHVPLIWEGDGIISSTVGAMTPDFFKTLRAAGCSHYEVETYTFDVLPEELRQGDIADMMSRELGWLQTNWENSLET